MITEEIRSIAERLRQSVNPKKFTYSVLMHVEKSNQKVITIFIL